MPLFALAGFVAFGPFARDGAAQDASAVAATPGAKEKAEPSQAAPPNLSPDVQEVLKLVHARLAEGTIQAFVAGSGKVYNLGASEILYLRQEGVSDRVIIAMLEQRQKVTEATARIAPPTPAAPAAPTVAQPAVTVVQSAPASTPPATVYVVPSSSPNYVYYGGYSGYPYYAGYPYRGGYYGYSYPGVSLSFGFGGCYGGSSYHGSYYGGNHAHVSISSGHHH